MAHQSRTVLVVNSGSSSLKYAVVEPDSATMVADGIVERIGDGPVADHDAALQVAFDQLAESGQPLDTLGLVAVGPPGRAWWPRPVRTDAGR